MPNSDKFDAEAGSAVLDAARDALSGSTPPFPVADEALSDFIAMPSELIDLFAACTARIEAGETVDIEQLAAEHPAHAVEIRKLLPTLHGLAGLKQAFAADPALAQTDASGVEAGRAFGDFRIVRSQPIRRRVLPV